MPTHAYIRRSAGVTTLCACLIAASHGAAAQGRFELLSGDAVAGVQGLSIYTVRDNRAAVCYTLFVLGAFDAESSRNTRREPGETAEDLDKIRVAEMLKEARAIRDQKVAELRSASVIGWTAAQIYTAREQIDDEYESAVRHVLPSLHPPARIMPGLRSTSTDELNEAVRQAIADGDAVTAAAARTSRDDQVLRQLDRMMRSPRLAVGGPTACAPKIASPPPR